MNIIEELAKKYNGIYAEETAKNVNSPIGKYTYQPKKGIIEIDGTKISVNINEVGGATPVTEPIRITLFLDKIYETELTIFPKDIWKKILELIQPKRNVIFPEPIRKQFWFGGKTSLLKQLASDNQFAKSLVNERIYIETDKNQTNQITLTPEYGIENLNQFEKFISILQLIETKIKAD